MGSASCYVVSVEGGVWVSVLARSVICTKVVTKLWTAWICFIKSSEEGEHWIGADGLDEYDHNLPFLGYIVDVAVGMWVVVWAVLGVVSLSVGSVAVTGAA